MQQSRSTWPTLAIFILAILQFCLFLNHRDITTTHEGRTAATAREMLQRRQWIVPYCNDAPRLAKPPLMYWACDLAWSIFGKVAVWSARLPAALCGAIAVLLVMDLGRRMLGRDAGICAGLVWVSTWFIVDEYRKAMTDPYLAFFTLLSIWAWIAADQTKSRRASRWLILLCYGSAALGTLAKVHVIFVHMALALIPYHWLRKSRPKMLKMHVVGALLLLVIASAWPFYIYRTVPNAWNVWRRDVLASESTSGPTFSPVYDYILGLPLMALPWTVAAFIGALMPVLAKRRRERRMLWPLLWLAGSVVLFTLLPMKKNTYLLPTMPAVTLLTAGVLAIAIRQPRAAKDAANERILLIGHFIGALIAASVCLILLMRIQPWRFNVPTCTIAAAALFAAIALGMRQMKPPLRSLRMVAVIAVLFALSIHVAEAWTIPDLDNRRSNAPFARMIQQRVAPNESLILIGPGLREDVLFYLDGRTVPHVDSIKELPADFHGYAIVVHEQYESVRASNRGVDVATSADRQTGNELYLFHFSGDPAAH